MPNQQQQFSLPAGFVSSCVFFLCVFLCLICWLEGNKASFLSVLLFPLRLLVQMFPSVCLVHRLKSSHTSCEAVTTLFVYVRLCLFYSCVSWTGSFVPLVGVWNSRQSGLWFCAANNLLVKCATSFKSHIHIIISLCYAGCTVHLSS